MGKIDMCACARGRWKSLSGDDTVEVMMVWFKVRVSELVETRKAAVLRAFDSRLCHAHGL